VVWFWYVKLHVHLVWKRIFSSNTVLFKSTCFTDLTKEKRTEFWFKKLIQDRAISGPKILTNAVVSWDINPSTGDTYMQRISFQMNPTVPRRQGQYRVDRNYELLI
jgi:hypothetical protein